MSFLNSLHESNYKKLAKKASLNIHDVERKSLFYIIAGNKDLFSKSSNIYNFNENCINFNSLNKSKTDFCSSSKALIRLGFNLFNGYTDKYTNPLFLLGCLDQDNYKIATNAIHIRFCVDTYK